MDLGDRIGLVRELAHLSQRQMSELAGLSETHVRLLETGARKEPSVETVRRLAETFDVSLDWLISGIGAAPAAEAVVEAVERARAAQRKLAANGDG